MDWLTVIGLFALLTNSLTADPTGASLRCGEEIVVQRGEMKVLRFWSSEDKLLKVDVLPMVTGGSELDQGASGGSQITGEGQLDTHNSFSSSSSSSSSGNSLRADLDELKEEEQVNYDTQQGLYYGYGSRITTSTTTTPASTDEGVAAIGSAGGKQDTNNNNNNNNDNGSSGQDSGPSVNTVFLDDSIIYDYRTGDENEEYTYYDPNKVAVVQSYVGMSDLGEEKDKAPESPTTMHQPVDTPEANLLHHDNQYDHLQQNDHHYDQQQQDDQPDDHHYNQGPSEDLAHDLYTSGLSSDGQGETLSEATETPTLDILLAATETPAPETPGEVTDTPALEILMEAIETLAPESTLKEATKTPTPETLLEVTETPVPEILNKVTETPTPETQRKTTETPTPETLRETNETATPETPRETTETETPETLREVTATPETLREATETATPETLREVTATPETLREATETATPENLSETQVRVTLREATETQTTETLREVEWSTSTDNSAVRNSETTTESYYLVNDAIELYTTDRVDVALEDINSTSNLVTTPNPKDESTVTPSNVVKPVDMIPQTVANPTTQPTNVTDDGADNQQGASGNIFDNIIDQLTAALQNSPVEQNEQQESVILNINDYLSFDLSGAEMEKVRNESETLLAEHKTSSSQGTVVEEPGVKVTVDGSTASSMSQTEVVTEISATATTVNYAYEYTQLTQEEDFKGYDYYEDLVDSLVAKDRPYQNTIEPDNTNSYTTTASTRLVSPGQKMESSDASLSQDGTTNIPMYANEQGVDSGEVDTFTTSMVNIDHEVGTTAAVGVDQTDQPDSSNSSNTTTAFSVPLVVLRNQEMLNNLLSNKGVKENSKVVIKEHGSRVAINSATYATEEPSTITTTTPPMHADATSTLTTVDPPQPPAPGTSTDSLISNMYSEDNKDMTSDFTQKTVMPEVMELLTTQGPDLSNMKDAVSNNRETVQGNDIQPHNTTESIPLAITQTITNQRDTTEFSGDSLEDTTTHSGGKNEDGQSLSQLNTNGISSTNMEGDAGNQSGNTPEEGQVDNLVGDVTTSRSSPSEDGTTTSEPELATILIPYSFVNYLGNTHKDSAAQYQEDTREGEQGQHDRVQPAAETYNTPENSGIREEEHLAEVEADSNSQDGASLIGGTGDFEGKETGEQGTQQGDKNQEPQFGGHSVTGEDLGMDSESDAGTRNDEGSPLLGDQSHYNPEFGGSSATGENLEDDGSEHVTDAKDQDQYPAFSGDSVTGESPEGAGSGHDPINAGQEGEQKLVYIGEGDQGEKAEAMPEYDESRPGYGEESPGYGESSPEYGEERPGYGERSPEYGEERPGYGESRPGYGENRPIYGEARPEYSGERPSYSEDRPDYSAERPEGRPGYSEDRPVYGERRPEYSEGYAEGRPEYTEGRPGYTDGRPEYTEERPEYTEGRPEYTKRRPEYTDGRPEYSDGRPDYTERRPEYTEGRPEYTKGRPEYTEERPEYTEERPEYTEERPEYTEGRPEYTEERPEYTEERPEYTEGRPEYTEERPEYTEGRPEYTEERPEYTGERPEQGAVGLEVSEDQTGGAMSRKEDSGQEDYGGDSPFFINLPGSPNAVPVFLQYEPVRVKYVPSGEMGSSPTVPKDSGQGQGVDGSSSREGVVQPGTTSQQGEHLVTDTLKEMLEREEQEVRTVEGGEEGHQSPSSHTSSLMSGIYRILDDVSAAVNTYETKEQKEDDMQPFTPHRPVAKTPDPFFLMEPPKLGNDTSDHNNRPHILSDTHQDSPNQYTVQLSSKVDIKSQERPPEMGSSKGTVEDVPLGTKQEILYPGNYYIHNVFNLTSLKNPVFELSTQPSTQSLEDRLNPQYTPFPITTNPPRTRITPRQRNQYTPPTTTPLPIPPPPPPPFLHARPSITLPPSHQATPTTVKVLPSMMFSPMPAVDFEDSYDSGFIPEYFYDEDNNIIAPSPIPPQVIETHDALLPAAARGGSGGASLGGNVRRVSAAPFKIAHEAVPIPTHTESQPPPATSTETTLPDTHLDEMSNSTKDDMMPPPPFDFMAHQQVYSFPNSREKLQEDPRYRYVDEEYERIYTAFYSPREIPGVDPSLFSYRKVPRGYGGYDVTSSSSSSSSTTNNNDNNEGKNLPAAAAHSATPNIGSESSQNTNRHHQHVLGPHFFKYLRSLPYAMQHKFLDPTPEPPLGRLRRAAPTPGDQIFCEWNIKTEPNLYMLITFHNLSAAYTVDCHGAYIEVERENNGYDARWCGNRVSQSGSRPHIIFAKTEVRITVYDDGDSNKDIPTGFEADIEVIDLFDARDYTAFMRSNSYPHIRRLLLG